MMQSTPSSSERLAPLLTETMRDAWKELVGPGQDAHDLRKPTRCPWEMTLRPMYRAMALGRPKPVIVGYYAQTMALADAMIPDEQPVGWHEASLEEERANHRLNAIQVMTGPVPTVAQLLEAKRHGRAQISATIQLLGAADRLLAKIGRG